MHGCRMIGVRTRENKIKDCHANFQWGVGFESDPEGFQMQKLAACSAARAGREK